MTSLQKKVQVGAISNIFGVVAQKIIVLCSIVIIIRSISVSEYGLYSLFISSVIFLSNMTFGLDLIVQRYFPMVFFESPKKALLLLTVFLLKRTALLGLLVSSVYLIDLLGIVELDRFQIPHITLGVVLGLIMAIRQLLTQALNAAFLEHQVINGVLVLGELTKLILLVVFWDNNLSNLILIWGIGEVLMSVAIAARMMWRIKGACSNDPVKVQINDLDYRRYYNYGKYVFFASIGSYLLMVDIDYYFLSYFHNEHLVGIYAFSVKVPILLLALAPSQILHNVALPLLIQRHDSGIDLSSSKSRIITLTKFNTVFWTFLAGCLICIFQFVVGLLFDSSYLEAMYYVYIWMLFFYISVLKGVYEPIARAMEFSKVYIFTVIAAFMNILLNFLLVPTFGIEGALISSGIAITIQGGGICILVLKKLNIALQFGKL